MSQATVSTEPVSTKPQHALQFRPCWSDRLFAATRVEPAWVGVALAACLLIPTLIGAAATGRIALLAELGPAALLTERDARAVILFVVLLAYTVTARRYVLLGAERSFDALAPVLASQPGLDREALREETVERPTDARVRRRRAMLSLLIVPVVAFAIDGDLRLYLRRDYWNFEQAVERAVGVALCWNLGLLIDATLESSRRFSELARRLVRIDLLRLDGLAPFANLGLRIALVWLLLASIFALNLVDSGYWSSVLVLSILSVMLGMASVLPPMLGARDRVRASKREELERVARALHGAPGALRGSVLETRSDTVGVSDLLAYRDHVAALPEWPFNAPMLMRLLLYVAIPIGSWVGGAFVEQLLETTLR